MRCSIIHCLEQPLKRLETTTRQGIIQWVSSLKDNFFLAKSMHTGDEGFPGFVLPAINHQNSKGSPFRGFKDISIVTQKIRKDMHS